MSDSVIDWCRVRVWLVSSRCLGSCRVHIWFVFVHVWVHGSCLGSYLVCNWVHFSFGSCFVFGSCQVHI